MAIPTRPEARWAVTPRDPDAEARLRSELGLGPLACAALAARGWTDPGAARELISPSYSQLADPRLLPDFEEAVRALLKVRAEEGLVFVHGDYDVDGVSSTAILARFLQRTGFRVHPYVPHRIERGYGVHADAVRDAQALGAGLFLTCDCGVSAHEQMQAVRDAGMAAVVTDHHLPKDSLPVADAVVNPHRSDSRYPFADLCGAGVAWQLCAGLGRELGHDIDRVREAYVDLAALGTVADVMPLRGENRVIASLGLQRLPHTRKPGLIELLAVCGLLGPDRHITSRSIGFQIGPRINAVGRISDAAHALRLLLTEERSEAKMIAQELDRYNTERREEQERVLVQARELAAARPDCERVLLVLGEDWHEGVIGIVAGRLKDDSYRPALVATKLEDGSAKGSARSVPGFHLGEALDAAAGLMMGHGGHELAAGFRIDPARIDDLRSELNRIAAGLPEEIFRPRLDFDAEIEPEELDPAQARELELLEPFGAANPEPLFLLQDARIAESSPLGKDGRHVRATIEAGGVHAPAVAFGLAEELSRPGARWDFALKLEVNRWNGREEARWSIAQARARA